MKPKLSITCSTPNDGSHFSRGVLAPFHGIGPNGVEGETDEEFEKNLALSDSIMAAMYQGMYEATTCVPEGGLGVDLEIGPGELDFDDIRQQVYEAVSKYLNKTH